MTSPKQRAANAANAQHSTGPTTPEGRARSSQNAFKNGLASGRIIIDGEDIAEFQALCERLAAEHRPLTETETILVQAMAKHHWLENRAQRLQAAAFDNAGGLPPELPLLIRYETTHHRAFHKSLDALLKFQKQRPQPEIGFVSQNDVPLGHARWSAPDTNEPNPPIGVVSQNLPRQDAKPANPTHPFADLAHSREKPDPANGFVSQNDVPLGRARWSAAAPDMNEPNPPIGFVSQKSAPYIRPTPKISRNAPCPCRSGKKFKRCCLGKPPGKPAAA